MTKFLQLLWMVLYGIEKKVKQVRAHLSGHTLCSSCTGSGLLVAPVATWVICDHCDGWGWEPEGDVT